MSELKPCPFCGEPADDRYQRLAKCCNDKCLMNEWVENDTLFYLDEVWNNRPIEDALHARIAELEGEVEALKAEHRWIPVSEPPKIDGTYLLRNTCTDVYSCNFIADTNTWVLSGYDSITHWMPLPKLPEVQE